MTEKVSGTPIPASDRASCMLLPMSSMMIASRPGRPSGFESADLSCGSIAGAE